jgi:hypothetical protein
MTTGETERGHTGIYNEFFRVEVAAFCQRTDDQKNLSVIEIPRTDRIIKIGPLTKYLFPRRTTATNQQIDIPFQKESGMKSLQMKSIRQSTRGSNEANH